MANYFEQHHGFILRSENGDLIATYDQINPQDNGITFVYIKDQGWGVVKDGVEIISPNFPYIKKYENGLAIFGTHSEHEGAIDENGNIAIEPDFKKIYGFNAMGISIVLWDDNTCNLINTSGKTLFLASFPKIIELKNGFFKILNNDLWALANPNGKTITQFKYKGIKHCTNDLFIATLDNGEVVIDATGKEITTEHNFIQIMPNSLIVTYDNSKILTMFDKTGSIVFVKQYDKEQNCSAIISKLTDCFKSCPNATVIDGKLTIPWEIFGI